MFEVGSLYMRGLGTEKNLMKAGRDFTIQIEKNARASKFSQKDFAYKFDLLIEIERASNGNITSLENLGWNYFDILESTG